MQRESVKNDRRGSLISRKRHDVKLRGMKKEKGKRRTANSQASEVGPVKNRMQQQAGDSGKRRDPAANERTRHEGSRKRKTQGSEKSTNDSPDTPGGSESGNDSLDSQEEVTTQSRNCARGAGKEKKKKNEKNEKGQAATDGFQVDCQKKTRNGMSYGEREGQ